VLTYTDKTTDFSLLTAVVLCAVSEYIHERACSVLTFNLGLISSHVVLAFIVRTQPILFYVPYSLVSNVKKDRLSYYRVGHKSLDKNAFKSLASVKRLMAHPTFAGAVNAELNKTDLRLVSGHTAQLLILM
jgi:hypothetical protein